MSSHTISRPCTLECFRKVPLFGQKEKVNALRAVLINVTSVVGLVGAFASLVI